MLGDLGAHLGGVAVDGLFARRRSGRICPLQLLHSFDGLAEGYGWWRGVPSRRRPVRDQIRLVGRDGQALLQSGLGLLGPMDSTTILASGPVLMRAAASSA